MAPDPQHSQPAGHARAASNQNRSTQERGTGSKATQRMPGHPSQRRNKPEGQPVRNMKVVDEWNALLRTLKPDARQIKHSEVTSTGDGAQIPGFSKPDGKDKSKGPATRDPGREMAMAAIKVYQDIDRTKIPINALFSAKEKDIALIESFKAKGAYIENDGTNGPPANALYVVARILKGSKGKEVRQMVAIGVVLDRRTVPPGKDGAVRQEWTTMNVDDLNARTDAAISKIRLSKRIYSEAQKGFANGDPEVRVIGCFDPGKLPRNRQEEAGAPRDPYDQTNVVTRKILDGTQVAKEGRKLAVLGHRLMGADWHATENWTYRWVEEREVDHEVVSDPLPSLHTIIKKKDLYRKKIEKPVAPGAEEAKKLAYEILPGNPDKLRYKEDGTRISYYTTCVDTASKILNDYGIEARIFFGFDSPVFQLPKQVRPRDTAIFLYLKQTGAWVWGFEGFVPSPGDIFLTGSFTDGVWVFQHIGVIAHMLRNDNGTYTLLTQDGGKGDSTSGEDKTGYTIRNYNPATRLLSGAKPKMLIGVWRPGLLKAALEQMPDDVKATLKPETRKAYERSLRKLKGGPGNRQ